MEFIAPKIEDYGKYAAFLKSCDEPTCENSFLNAVMWQEEYSYEYCIYGNSLIIRLTDGKNRIYSLPIGKNDFSDAVKEIITQEGQNVMFFAPEGDRLKRFVSEFGGDFEVLPVPENFEYIYDIADLSGLKGKKYHSKRNHISAFSRTYDWRYRSMTEDDIGTVLSITDAWSLQKADGSDQEISTERKGIEIAMRNYNALGIVGGIIEVENKAVAFCFGTEINKDTFDVNIEKALPDFQDAYPVINNEFVKHELCGYKYVNREDDLGIEGLRTAKMSYHPTLLLKKYIIKKSLG